MRFKPSRIWKATKEGLTRGREKLRRLWPGRRPAKIDEQPRELGHEDILKHTREILEKCPFDQNKREEAEEFNKWVDSQIHGVLKKYIYGSHQSAETVAFDYIAAGNQLNIKGLARVLEASGIPQEKIHQTTKQVLQSILDKLMQKFQIVNQANQKFDEKYFDAKMLAKVLGPDKNHTVGHLWTNSITLLSNNIQLMQMDL